MRYPFAGSSFRWLVTIVGLLLSTLVSSAYAGVSCTPGTVIASTNFGWGYQYRRGADLYVNGGVLRAYCDIANLSTIDFGMFGGNVNEHDYGSQADSRPPPNPLLLPNLDRIRLPLAMPVDIALPGSASTVVNGSGCVGSACSYTIVRGPATYACTSGLISQTAITGYDGYGGPIYGDVVSPTMVGEPYGVFGMTAPTGCWTYVSDATYHIQSSYPADIVWYTCDSGGSLFAGACYNPSGGQVKIVSTAGGGTVINLNFTLPSITANPPTSIAASDFLYPDRVQVDVTVGADSTCTSLDTIVSRDGADVQTFNNGVLSSPISVQYLDYAATPGVHSYSARNVCHVNTQTAVSTPVSDYGSKRYASPSCSAISPIQPSIAYTSGASLRVNITGVSDAASARIVAYGLISGSNDLTSYAADGGPPTCSGLVQLDNHAPGTPEYGTVRLEAHLTGLNPDELDVVCATGSFAMTAPPPVNVVATDGTVVGAVNITWDPVPGAAAYQVVECPDVAGQPVFSGPGNSGAISVAGSACSLIGGQVATPAYTKNSPGTTHDVSRFAVYAVGGDGVTFGLLSATDPGYPDRPPTAAVATGSVIYGSNTAVAITPVVTDVNTPEVFTFQAPVTTTAFGGSISVLGSTIQYTPPAVPRVGVDTFSFLAYDKAGASVPGTGTVDSGCPAPTVSAVAVLPSRVLPNAGFRVAVSYGNSNCPHLTSATAVVTGPSTVAPQTIPSVAPATAGTLFIDFPGASVAGPYTVSVTLNDTVDATSSSRSATFVVAPFTMPTIPAPLAALEFIETATMSATATPDCQLTTSDADAAADPTKCLMVASGLPPGVSVVPNALRPTWAGVSTAAATYPITVDVQQYDLSGVKRTLGTIPVSMTIAPLSSMVFTSATPLVAKLHLRAVTMTVAQTGGPNCVLINDRVAAQAFAAAGTRRCLLGLPSIPSGFQATPTGITGTSHSMSMPDVPWTVSIYDAGGTEHIVSTGTVVFSVQPLDLAYRLAVQPAAPAAGVSNVSIQLAPIATDTCPLTTSLAIADNPTSSNIYCLVEWGTPPPGLSQPLSFTLPMLRGVFASAGTVSVPFVISVFSPDHTKYQIFSASPTLDVAAPPTPSVVLLNMHEISPDVYNVPMDGGYYGNIGNCPGCGAVIVTQTTQGDATPKVMSILSPSGRQSLVGTPATLWQQRAATLRVALANAPSYFAEKAITLVSVPPTTAKVLLTIPGPDVPDNAPVALTATVGVFGSTGFAYDAAKLGAWRVRFGTQDANGNFTPLTGYIDTDGSGVASGTVDPASQLVMKLVAVAEPVSPVPGYTASISSFVRVIRVVKGTPVSGHLEVSASDGPAPLLTVIKVVYDSRADQVANGGVVWYRSDDGGATYSQIPDFTNPVLVTRLAEGSAMFKVGFINHNTSVTSESPAVTVTAFGVPQVVLSGDIYSFPGTTATVTAVARRPDGTVIPGAVFDWSVAPRATTNVPPAPIATGTGPTATFSSAVAGVFTVKYRARLATSPDADPRSWGERNQQVIFDGAQKPNVRVTGPIRVEVGKTYVYTANVTAPFPITSSPLSLGGQWSLPDGSTVSGTTLNWTPTAADLAAGVSGRVTYSAWIVGYEATTTASAYQAVTLWRYVFPTWHAVTQLGATVAPAGVTVALIADNPLLVSTLEGLTYTWSVPAGIRVNGTPVSKLSGIADFGGTYPVDVTVSDTRGNSQTVSSVVTVNNPAPYVMTVAVSKISRWSHAPLIVGFTPKVTGGHPSDSIVTWQYFVDGVQQPALPNRAGVQITFDSPGTYSVESRGLSRMGATVSQTVVANVPANIAPSCTVDAVVSSNRTQVALRANCADPDGAIVRYDWSVNGVPRTGVAGVWTYIKPTSTSFPITFDLTVTDDGGGTSSASATAN